MRGKVAASGTQNICTFLYIIQNVLNYNNLQTCVITKAPSSLRGNAWKRVCMALHAIKKAHIRYEYTPICIKVDTILGSRSGRIVNLVPSATSYYRLSYLFRLYIFCLWW